MGLERDFEIITSEQIKSIVFMTRFLNKPTIEGSDQVRCIHPTFRRKPLAAIFVNDGSRRLTFDQGLRGACINPSRLTFTILLSNQNGNPDYATFDYAKHTFSLVWGTSKR